MRQLILRVDDDLHARLKARAKAERRSMNAVATELLARELPPPDAQTRLAERVRAAGLEVELPPVEGRILTDEELSEMTRGIGPVFSEALDWARGKR